MDRVDHEMARDSLGSPIPVLALGDVTVFELTAGTPDESIGPFDTDKIIRVATDVAIRVVSDTDPDVEAGATSTLVFSPGEYFRLPYGEVFAVGRDSADATGSLTVMR